MKVALLSDVHANLPALEAVLEDIAARPGIDATYHLGDLVGYAPWPNETVALLREQRFLGMLPFRMDLRPKGGHQSGPMMILVHGTPTLNTLYWTEDRPDSFCVKMAEMAGAKQGDVICFGHTHRPWHREVDGIHFVNTGSVGRPKDGDWRAGYVVLTVGEGETAVEFVRVEHDLERTMGGSSRARYRAQQEGRPVPEPAGLGDIVMVEPVREARERGVLRSVRPFECFTEDGVVWSDGRKERIDAVIWCTGFASATLIGIGRTARAVTTQIASDLSGKN